MTIEAEAGFYAHLPICEAFTVKFEAVCSFAITWLLNLRSVIWKLRICREFLGFRAKRRFRGEDFS